jgi:hypothetical protein
VAHERMDFFRPKCAKARRQATILSKITPGLITRTPINKGKEGGAEWKSEA